MSISHSERLPSGCIIITHKPGFLCHILGWGHVTSPQIHVKHKFTFWPRKGQHHRSLEKKVLMKYRTHSSKDKDGNSQNDTVGIVILKVSSHLRKKYCPMDLLRLVVSLCQHCFGRFHLFFRGKGFPPTYPFGSPFQKKKQHPGVMNDTIRWTWNSCDPRPARLSAGRLARSLLVSAACAAGILYAMRQLENHGKSQGNISPTLETLEIREFFFTAQLAFGVNIFGETSSTISYDSDAKVNIYTYYIYIYILCTYIYIYLMMTARKQQWHVSGSWLL